LSRSAAILIEWHNDAQRDTFDVFMVRPNQQRLNHASARDDTFASTDTVTNDNVRMDWHGQ
jgi:hypothetical protein